MTDMEVVLKSAGQSHLLDGITDEQREALFKQVAELEKQLPGGVTGYVKTARQLLSNSAEGINPYEGLKPAVPEGVKLQVGTTAFDDIEAIGLGAIADAGFCLVAGGLGERLGYSGIKVRLPLYIVERQRVFLQLYIEHILELQRAHARGKKLPLAIMTSDDTHALTLDLLKEHGNFGMEEGQVHVMKQNKVPAMLDSAARFSGKNGKIDTKPHGHGDIHTLLHQHGIVEEWADAGVQWVCFFQDTNGVIFRALPAVVGVSVSKALDVNSLCVPRTPGEAVGAICRLSGKDRSFTVNVEYNQLDPLLRSTEGFSNGDVADPETGSSPFPGNINCLVFAMKRYKETLDATGGGVKEFVNPKYADAANKVFKSPTRLECMMQDFPLLLPPEAIVGFTQMDRWLCFSPVKNNIHDAAAKAAQGLPPECAGTAERDAFDCNCRLLRLAGVEVAPPAEGSGVEFAGIPLTFGPQVVLLPSFGTCLADVRARIARDSGSTISARSALVLEGDVRFTGRLKLDGALVVRAAPGARVTLRNLEVSNAGWSIARAAEADQADDELTRMRGFVVRKHETREIVVDAPGETVIDK